MLSIYGTGDDYYTDIVTAIYSSQQPLVKSTGHPSDAEVCSGNQVTFSCDGTYDETYAWYKLGSSTILSSTDQLTFTTSDGDDGNQYYCTLSNGCGTANTSNALLDVLKPLGITSNPADKTTCEGSAVQLEAGFSGDAETLTWRVSNNGSSGWLTLSDGGAYAGTKTTTLTITPGTTLNGKFYQLYTGNGTCSTQAQSTSAKLTVKTALKNITIDPSGTIYPCDFSPFALKVYYAGTDVDIKWQEYDGSWKDLGITGETLNSTANLNTNNNHRYQAVLSQSHECNTSVESDEVTLQIKSLPAISSDPSDLDLCLGDNAGFSITATGTGIQYQWQVNDGYLWQSLADTGNYKNTRTGTLDLTAVKIHQDGYMFRCVVSGDCNPSLTSVPATLNIGTAPEIIANPQNIIKCTGQDAMFTVKTEGVPPFSYKWIKDGITYVDFDQGDDTLLIQSLSTSNAGNYTCVIKNACNANGVSSDAASLIVNTAPLVTEHPDNVSVCSGTEPQVTFNTLVSGGTDLLWQVSTNEGSEWNDLVNDASYGGVTSNQLIVYNPDQSSDQYHYRCKVVGLCEPPVTSDPAILTIKTIPEITDHPMNDTVCNGEPLSFSVTASGTAPIEYKWKKAGKGITNWLTFSDITLDEVTIDDNGDPIICLVRNECAFNTPVESDEALLRVNPPPSVSLGSDTHICPGESLTLDAGPGYASYRWDDGQTTRKVIVKDQGSYRVTVTDDNACQNDDKVFVYHDQLVPILDLGDDASYCAGTDITLDAGSGYDVYEWSDGSTKQTFKPVSSGKFWVRASNNNTVCESADTINIIIAEPFDGDQICVVTVDIATGKNMVVWEKTPDKGIVAYKIYRETMINQYDVIGTVPDNELSLFKDISVSPENRAYLYKIQAIDTCGNATDLSGTPYHKPIYLNYVPSDIGVSLTWTDYKIEDVTDLGDYLTSFEIYRGTDSTDLQYYTAVGSVNNYLDTDPTTRTTKYWYRIAGVLKNPCTPSDSRKAGTGPYQHSLSNMDDNKLKEEETGIGPALVIPLQVYPNPFSEYTTIRFENPDGSEYTMYITDLSGKLVHIEKNIYTDEITLLRGNLKPGYYNIELRGKKLCRSKLIVR